MATSTTKTAPKAPLTAGAVAARWLFGPIGWLAFGADAASKSISGKHLHQHFFTVDVEKAAD